MLQQSCWRGARGEGGWSQWLAGNMHWPLLPQYWLSYDVICMAGLAGIGWYWLALACIPALSACSRAASLVLSSASATRNSTCGAV